MKKFLIFLVSIVVVVCLGLTTFYFMKNDEVITIETKELYVNASDTITLEELGITRKKANKKTTFNYNAGGEEVTSAINYDEEKGYYVVSGETAGDISLVITTSNKKYAEFTVTVHVGNGEKETPYYIFNETDLSKIGSEYALTDYFQLMNDITLSSTFSPIGYSELESKFVGFSGGFEGNGHTISSLNLVDGEYSNAGLFSSINAGASVSNLTIANANVVGTYANAGVLAGVVKGTVDRVAVLNSVVTNKASNSFSGALAGVVSNTNLKMSYADNVSVNAGLDSAVTDAVAGGLIGKVDQATVQATYVNNSIINVVEASTGKFGGFAGEFVIGTQAGSIQQSYANATSEFNGFGAFLGGITKTADFSATKNDSIRYLIGNAVVTNEKDVVTSGNYDATLFETFQNSSNSTYLISSYSTANEFVIDAETDNGIIFYAISSNEITYWDKEYVWKTSNTSLPTLRMGKVEPTSPSGDYFRKDLANNEINETTTKFEDVFSSDVENMKFTLTDDVTLASWTPVALTNVTLDGDNHTITVNLNNANGENLGLFSILDNCTIKNLNIVVTNVSANAHNVGALAGFAKSADTISTTTIENVIVSFNNVENITATNFGGIVGAIENTNISNSNVTALNVNANIANVGGLVALVNSDATVKNCSVNAEVSGLYYVGGAVAANSGTISNISATVIVNFNSGVEDTNEIGGLVGHNVGTITNANINVTINVNSTDNPVYVGGVAGVNAGEISNSKISGTGIAVAEINTNVYVGGLVAENSGNISNVQNNLEVVGTYHISKNVKAGGVAYNNTGSISKVVVTSNVYGNYVAGLVVEMNSSSATIDQIAIQNNTISGDKYVAGIVVDFRAGNITNIQASSTIEGEANSTRSSLVALIFPYGANLKNATISSSIGGYGTFYRETWTDFASYSNKAEFGLTANNNGLAKDASFNLYSNDTHHGSMQSVVIDSSKAGVSSAKAAMGGAFAWGKDYTDSSISSFIKIINGFNNISQFQGSFEFQCAESNLFGINHYATRTLTFAVGTVWEDNGSGISLIFLSNLE